MNNPDRDQIDRRIINIVQQRRSVLVNCPSESYVDAVLTNLIGDLQDLVDDVIKTAMTEAGS